MSRLDEIKARADAATPWHAWDRGIGWEVHKGEECAPGGRQCDELNGEFRGTFTREDAAFIAAASVDVPWLLALVESLTAERDDMAWQRTQALNERDALAAQVARVEKLAEEWRYKGEFGWGAWQLGEGPDPEGYVMDHCASALRDALAGSDADTGEQETGHKCEPYYSRAECGQCGWQGQWCVTCSRQMCGCATDAMGADQ